jgi:hypothetical protein
MMPPAASAAAVLRAEVVEVTRKTLRMRWARGYGSSYGFLVTGCGNLLR